MKNRNNLVLMFLLMFFCFLNAQKSEDSYFEKIQPLLYENPDKAIKVAQELIHSENDIDKKINYYLYLSKAYTAKRNSDASYKTLLKAQEILKNSKNVDSKINVLILIAIQYQQMELYNNSFEILDEVDQLCSGLKDKDELQKNSWLGKSNAIKGIIYKSKSNNEIALEKFFNAIQNLERANQSIANVNNSSIVYYNIGYCYINLEKLTEAEKYLKESLRYAQKTNAQSLEAYALKGLAEVAQLQQDHQKAINLLEISKEKAGNIGDLVLNEAIYGDLAESYLSLGNFEKYLYNNEAYKKAQFQKEQNELMSINSFIENMRYKNIKRISENNENDLFVNILIIILSLTISGFLGFKIFIINKTIIRNKKKIQELITK